MKHDEFRVKDIAGSDGAIVYELEHEVRTLRHPGFVAKQGAGTHSRDSLHRAPEVRALIGGTRRALLRAG